MINNAAKLIDNIAKKILTIIWETMTKRFCEAMNSVTWLIFSLLLGASGYLIYGLGIRRQLVEPNRASWLIWSATTSIEAMTYSAVNEGALQNLIFAMSAASCILVTIAVWRRSIWQRPSDTETLCMASCAASLILWIGFQNALWAHILVVLAVPISFIPTWVSVTQDRRREISPAWGLWTLGDLGSLFVIADANRFSITELPYVLLELTCHASVWLMIGLATINPARSFRFVGGKLMSRVVDSGSKNAFLVGHTKAGKGVFSEGAISAGSLIVEFSGSYIHRSQIKDLTSQNRDRFVQIDLDLAMGPSGHVDDIINHSCNPNAGLRFTGAGIMLVAIRDIRPSEELTWDYSTTWLEFPGDFTCLCASDNCRKTVGDFRTLPRITQLRYRKLGILPDYILATMLPASERQAVGANQASEDTPLIVG